MKQFISNQRTENIILKILKILKSKVKVILYTSHATTEKEA